jgi:uncharacterized protein YeaO (DUF488 family)
MEILKTNDLNKLYAQIRENLKDWKKDFQIKNTELRKYFQSNPKNIEKFFWAHKIELNPTTERILNDILEDLSINENYTTPSTSMKDYENILADIFDVGLSHIELLDDTINLFKVKDFNSQKKVIVINKKDKEILKSRILQRVKVDIQKQKLIVNPDPNGSYIATTKPQKDKINSQTIDLFKIENLDKVILDSIKDEDIIDWIIKIPYIEYPFEVISYHKADGVDYWIIK